MRRLAALLLASCNALDPGVLYRCESDGSCAPAGTACWSDGYCHAGAEPDAGSAGGGGGGGGPGGGATAGGSTGGGDGGGSGGGAVSCTCPSAACGFFTAAPGCPEQSCGLCAAGLECGVLAPNRCAPAQVCTSDGWCFEHPLPQGYTVRGAWASSPRSIWLAAENRTLLWWNGERHQTAALPPLDEGVDLVGVHGSGPGDIYVVGSRSTVLHFDGTAWTKETVPYADPLRGVWALSDGGAFAVGANLALYARTGSGWLGNNTTFGPAAFNDVTNENGRWVAAADYGVGSLLSGAVAMSPADAGVTWSSVTRLPMLGANSLLLTRDGGLLVAGDVDGGSVRLGGVTRRLGDGGYALALTFPQPLLVIRGDSADDYWVAGRNGLVSHVVDGVPDTRQLFDAWFALAVTDAGALMEGRNGQAAFIDARDAGLSALSLGSPTRLNGLCATGSGGLFAPSVGTPGCTGSSCSALLLERALDGGARWSSRPLVLRDADELTGCAAALDFRWVSGDVPAYLVELGGTWREITLPTAGTRGAGIYLRTTGEGWVAHEQQPFVTRLEGSIASPMITELPYDGGGDFITAIGGSPASTWAVGMAGLLFARLADGGLEQQPRLGADHLRVVAGATLTDGGSLVVVAGDNGARYRQFGSGAFVAEPEGQADLRAAHVTQTGSAWAVGSTPDAGRRFGRVFTASPLGAWSPVPYFGDGVVTGVVSGRGPDGGEAVWTTSSSGAVLRRAPP